MTGSSLRRYSPRRRHEPATLPPPSALDGRVVGAVGMLAGMGLVMIYSVTAPLSSRALPPELTRHLVALAAGGLVMIASLRVPLAAWRRVALPLWAVSLLLLVATAAVGVEVKGARRWLAVPGTGARFQPAELAKLATLLAVAAVLARARSPLSALRPVVAAGVLTAPVVGLLLLQPDFGSAAVLSAGVGFLLFAGGLPLRQLAGAAGLAGAGAALFMAARPYALARWRGFLDPWGTASREGFQLVQSFVAFGRGGPAGVGLGDGRQKLHYLPEAHTDFILSGIAEELGLVGVLFVLGAFAALAAAGTRIAQRARDPFAALVALAATAFVAVPAAVNAAVVMGLLPTTGFTLPFVSFGTNSLLACALAVGILLRVGAWEAAPRGRRAPADPARRRRRA